MSLRLVWSGATAALLAASTTAVASPPIASSRFATLEGARVHYSDYGEGEAAVVLVHGWNCDETVWKEQCPALAAKTRLLTIDLPGHGQSDKPEVAYTMDLHARAIDAVLQHAGVKSAVLVGHSNGTPVVRQFYRRYPGKVTGLVMVDGALRPFGDAATMEKFIAPMRGGDYALTIGRFVDGITGSMKDPAARGEVKKMMTGAPQNVAVSELEALLDPALWEESRIEVPVLMIQAKQPAWTVEYEQFVRGLIPDLDYQVWDGVSHFLFMDKPQEFNEALLGFLTRKNLLTRDSGARLELRATGSASCVRTNAR